MISLQWVTPLLNYISGWIGVPLRLDAFQNVCNSCMCTLIFNNILYFCTAIGTGSWWASGCNSSHDTKEDTFGVDPYASPLDNGHTRFLPQCGTAVLFAARDCALSLYIIECLVELAPRFITWPTAAERRVTKAYFRQVNGFPGVIGCIDGTFHNVIAPRFDKVRSVNRHHQYALNTQVVCDHRLLIRDIVVGNVGSVHDSRVFRESNLCRRLLEDRENVIGFDEHLLGDGGYILLNSVRIKSNKALGCEPVSLE